MGVQLEILTDDMCYGVLFLGVFGTSGIDVSSKGLLMIKKILVDNLSKRNDHKQLDVGPQTGHTRPVRKKQPLVWLKHYV